MAKFVDFKDSDDIPVAINPDHVAWVRPEPNDPDNSTVIHLANGNTIGVQGKQADVVEKLATA